MTPRIEDDLPPDPDWADVPPALAALDGQPVTVVEADGTVTTGSVLIVPGLWGAARRHRERTDNDDTEGDETP